MALSAHLAAVQSGMALMIFGLVWQLLNLKGNLLKVAFYSCLGSMYIIWFAITLGAVSGVSKALPMAGQGFAAAKHWELLVEIIVTAGAGLGVVAIVLIVFGLYKGLTSDSQ